jgi:hypothetical protein
MESSQGKVGLQLGTIELNLACLTLVRQAPEYCASYFVFCFGNGQLATGIIALVQNPIVPIFRHCSERH